MKQVENNDDRQVQDSEASLYEKALNLNKMKSKLLDLGLLLHNYLVDNWLKQGLYFHKEHLHYPIDH